MTESIGWIVAGIAFALLGFETSDAAPWLLSVGCFAWSAWEIFGPGRPA